MYYGKTNIVYNYILCYIYYKSRTDENHEYPLLPNGKSTENAIFTVQTQLHNVQKELLNVINTHLILLLSAY